MLLAWSVRAVLNSAGIWTLCFDLDCIAVLGMVGQSMCCMAGIQTWQAQSQARHKNYQIASKGRLCLLCVLWDVSACCCDRWGYFAIGCFWMFVVFWGLFKIGEQFNRKLVHSECSARICFIDTLPLVCKCLTPL
jgi:hypothetical protein